MPSKSLEELLSTVDPLKRPDPFGLEAALEEALEQETPSADTARATLQLDAAERLLDLCMTCDAMYTYNVIDLAKKALALAATHKSAALELRAHCLLARTYCFHLVGDKTENLATARQHLQAAQELATGPEPQTALAEALVDVARSAQLAREQAGISEADVDALYAMARERLTPEETPGLWAAAARELVADHEFPLSDADFAEEDALRALEVSTEGILPPRLIAVADRLGSFYLKRAAPGDGDRARTWLQRAERALYYLSDQGRAQAQNQLNLGSYFSLVTVEGPEDEAYVLNKAWLALQTSFYIARERAFADIQVESLLAMATFFMRQHDVEQAEACLLEALAVPDVPALNSGRLYELYARFKSRTDLKAALEYISIAVDHLKQGDPEGSELLAAMQTRAELLNQAAARGLA